VRDSIESWTKRKFGISFLRQLTSLDREGGNSFFLVVWGSSSCLQHGAVAGKRQIKVLVYAINMRGYLSVLVNLAPPNFR
jgi:hypothetical protein